MTGALDELQAAILSAGLRVSPGGVEADARALLKELHDSGLAVVDQGRILPPPGPAAERKLRGARRPRWVDQLVTGVVIAAFVVALGAIVMGSLISERLAELEAKIDAVIEAEL